MAASRLPSLVMAGVVGLAFTEAVGSVHAVARTEDCPGASAMAPALECSDLVVVEKLSTKYLHQHRRGDVVMLRSPHDPREHLFARLVALEGDRVRPAPAGWGLGTKEVPQGCCCVEDNAQSEMVPIPVLVGRVTHVLWPPWRAGRVASVEEPGRVTVRAPRRRG